MKVATTHEWGGYGQFVSDAGKLTSFTAQVRYGVSVDGGEAQLLPSCEQSLWEQCSADEQSLLQKAYDVIAAKVAAS